MMSNIIHGCHQSAPRELAPTSTSKPGTTNAFTCARKANRIENGCRRRSDSIADFAREQVVANAQRDLVFEARQLDSRMFSACGVNDQPSETVPALEGPLSNIGVLHSRARDVHHLTPVDA